MAQGRMRHRLLIIVLVMTPPVLGNSSVTKKKTNHTKKADVEDGNGKMPLESEVLKRNHVTSESPDRKSVTAQKGHPSTSAKENEDKDKKLQEINTGSKQNSQDQQETVKNKQTQEMEEFYQNGTKILKRSRDKNLRKESARENKGNASPLSDDTSSFQPIFLCPTC